MFSNMHVEIDDVGFANVNKAKINKAKSKAGISHVLPKRDGIFSIFCDKSASVMTIKEF